MSHAARTLRAVPNVDVSARHHIDRDAERAVLAAVLLTPSEEREERCSNPTLAKLAPLVQARDFGEPAHALFWEVFLALDASGEPIDVRTVCDGLRARERLHTVGGAQAVAELTDEIPTLAHCEAHARIVADLGALRRLQARVHALALTLVAAEGGARATVERAHKELAGMVEVRRRAGVTAAEHAAAAQAAILAAVEARAAGTFASARFGLECLDGGADGTHGGLLGGILATRVVTVSGPPGTGKTTFVAQAGTVTAEDGGRVLWFSTEVPGPEVATRYACQHADPPINQVDALAGCIDDDELLRLDAALKAFALLPMNIYSSDLSIDAIAATVASEVAQSARDGRPVRLVVLDYFQDLEDSERESEVAEAKYRARRVKDIARDHHVGVLVVSSLKKVAEERAAKGERAAASNLHGAGINYASDVVIELRAKNPDDRGVEIDVVIDISKARYGACRAPTVRFDKARGRFYEVVASDGELTDPMEGL